MKIVKRKRQENRDVVERNKLSERTRTEKKEQRNTRETYLKRKLC